MIGKIEDDFFITVLDEKKCSRRDFFKKCLFHCVYGLGDRVVP
jgi:hypothetical protein